MVEAATPRYRQRRISPGPAFSTLPVPVFSRDLAQVQQRVGIADTDGRACEPLGVLTLAGLLPGRSQFTQCVGVAEVGSETGEPLGVLIVAGLAWRWTELNYLMWP